MIDLLATADGPRLNVAVEIEEVLRSVPGWLASVGRKGRDPAADRLAPRVYADDDAAAEEFDRLMTPELDAGRTADRERYERVIDRAVRGGTILDEEDAFAVLRVLDEARLVIAARLGIDSDVWEPNPSMDAAPELHLYHLLGWIQDSLIGAAEDVLLGDG
ncbi:MAG: DUF2017 family protein [Acidimicrobiia bacterium]|nr:MAG: DUF2017 family protein [Acidimicrobiia bacterium]